MCKVSIQEQLLQRDVRRFRGGLLFKALKLCVSINTRLESNKEEKEGPKGRGNSGVKSAGVQFEGHDRGVGERVVSSVYGARCRV